MKCILALKFNEATPGSNVGATESDVASIELDEGGTETNEADCIKCKYNFFST